MERKGILVLNFGGQYAHLIANRIRRLNVYSEIADPTNEDFENVCGIILSGGPASVYDKDAPEFNKKIISLGMPLLGLCYGHQLLAQLIGGKVRQGGKKEYGTAAVVIDSTKGLLEGLSEKENVWMSHGDIVEQVPAEIIAHSENTPVAAFCKENFYGIQWHPEVVHTENGMKIFENFVFNICHCEKNWNADDFIDKAVEEIKNSVGDKKCIMALSGGVDSSVAAAIASKIVGKKLTAVFVDNGLMREGEPEGVKKAFEGYDMNLIIVDVRKRFLSRLKGVKDPEAKRKIIGEEFIRVFEEEAKKVGAKYLLQGTIYPDRIESGVAKHSDKIKTHHNVGGIPTKIDFEKIIEPLKDLYKDEVREVGIKLGLPKNIVWRQPFPGPGLAVRIEGEVTEKKVEIIKKADSIVRDEVDKKYENAGEKFWMYFPILTASKATGVKGDKRFYGDVVALRILESKEAMTARFAEVDWKLLEKISTRITNEIPEVARVVYDITHKPPATMEWE